MIILIPALEPDHRLVDLIDSIDEHHPHQRFVVVDDGSGPEYAAVFAAVAARGCDVVRHDVNRGKGAALKTGFAHIERCYPGHDVVCADSDGQHTHDDIAAVAAALRGHRADIVLGARQFSGDVPLRSRFGNTVTRWVLAAVARLGLQDTQTGLRGYPSALLPWLQSIEGTRFEYEFSVLLAAKRAGYRFAEVPIATIYLDGNRSSHFRTVRDSARVYLPFAKFAASSLSAFALDAVLLFTLVAATGSLVVSVVVARLVSATVNFTLNRRMVFADRASPLRSAATRYAALVAVLTTANYALLRVMTGPLALPLAPAKLLTEITLFALSFLAQSRVVFRHADNRAPLTAGTLSPAAAAPTPPARRAA